MMVTNPDQWELLNKASRASQPGNSGLYTEVMSLLRQQQDGLVVMPNLYDRALCFQLPASLETGLTVVVSPSIPLIEDQVNELQSRELPVAALHSQLPPDLRRETLRRLDRQALSLIFITPELLLSQPVWTRLTHSTLKLNGLLVDEAHTLVHWSEAFRPAYQRLGTVRTTLNQAFGILAFSAAADPFTQATIQRVLNLKQPQALYSDLEAPQVQMTVKRTWTPAGRRRTIANYIRKQESPGLIYARTHKDANELSEWLAQQGFKTLPYHSGLEASEQRQLERSWKKGDLQFLVCKTFKGILNPRCRWVAYYQPPATLTDYIQAISQAKQPSESFMVVSEPTGILDPVDRKLQGFLRQQWQTMQTQAIKLLQQLPDSGCLEDWGQSKDRTLALALLHWAGCIDWTHPFQFQVKSRPRQLPSVIPEGLDRFYADPLWAMDQWIYTRHCRWQVLRQGLGYSKGDPCCVCDNCRRDLG